MAETQTCKEISDVIYSNTDNYWNIPKDKTSAAERYNAVCNEIRSMIFLILALCDETKIVTAKMALIRLNSLYDRKETIAVSLKNFS